jgi:hypothetical protein
VIPRGLPINTEQKTFVAFESFYSKIFCAAGQKSGSSDNKSGSSDKKLALFLNL